MTNENWLVEMISSWETTGAETFDAEKYFNENNNLLIKELKGYHKIVGKIHNISVKNSYEIKEKKLEYL